MQGSSDEPETQGTSDGPKQTPANTLTATVSGPDGEQAFFDQDTVANVGEVREQPDSDGYELAAILSDEGTEIAGDAFRATGAAEAPGNATITITVDGEEANAYDVAPDLADSITSGDWDGLLLMRFQDEGTAETVKTELEES